MTKQNSSHDQVKVLFIDDEADLWIGRFQSYLGKYGLLFVGEQEAEQALTRITAEQPDVVLLDILFPGPGGRMEIKGPSVLAAIGEHFPKLPVVMITSTLTDAAYGIDEHNFIGASFLFSKDRFTDPSSEDPNAELAHQLLAAIKEIDNRRPMDERLGFVVGETPRMRRLAEKIVLIAPQDLPVLIYGETGTGKELVADALHKESGRSGKMLAIDCGRYAGDVLESQLFGHEKGAFTGAGGLHRGFFEEAHQGTLFLDEIHAMSAELQDRLLRVVQDKRIRRVGGKEDIQVDVRLVAASNRPLLQLIQEGLFREDLYARLAVVPLELPPLRERLADLPALFAALVTRLDRELRKNISAEARTDVIEKLASHGWPRNIRELENVLRHAMAVARANVLTPSTIELPIQGAVGHPAQAVKASPAAPSFNIAARILSGEAGWDDLKQIRGEFRHAILIEIYDALGRRLRRAPGSRDLAELLGTTDGNMRQVLNEFGGLKSLRERPELNQEASGAKEVPDA